MPERFEDGICDLRERVAKLERAVNVKLEARILQNDADTLDLAKAMKGMLKLVDALGRRCGALEAGTSSPPAADPDNDSQSKS